MNVWSAFFGFEKQYFSVSYKHKTNVYEHLKHKTSVATSLVVIYTFL